MKSKLFVKIFIYFSFLFCFLMGFLYFYLSPSIDLILKKNTQDSLKQQLLVLTKNFHSSPKKSIDSYLDEIAKSIRARLTFIDENGVVLGDSHLTSEEIRTIDNHANRPEIKRAQIQKWGMSERYSSTLKIRLMYIAQKIPGGYLRISLPMDYIHKNISQINKIIYFAFTGTLALGLIISFFISRKMTASLSQVSDFSQRIAKGDFSQNLRIDSNDEIEILAESLNKMALSLKRLLNLLENEKNQLKRILESITDGVLVTNENNQITLVNSALRQEFDLAQDEIGLTPLEYLRNAIIHESIKESLKEQKILKKEVELLITGQQKIFYVYTAPFFDEKTLKGSVSVFHNITQIRQLENLRKEFVANVSHEFKTPLTSILGYTETLLSSNQNETEKRFLQKISKNAELLKNLVEDILQISKIESGRMQILMEKINIHEFLEQMIGDLSDKAQQKQQKIINNLQKPQVSLPANTKALTQIFTNLIDNAIKYTPEKGTIEISSETSPQSLKIFVRDSGIGISQKDQLRIFERFYRVDRGRSRDMGGTGLGLSIVKHLVNAHKGNVYVQSEIGKGTTFTVELPL